jgi:hypothetical protein
MPLEKGPDPLRPESVLDWIRAVVRARELTPSRISWKRHPSGSKLGFIVSFPGMQYRFFIEEYRIRDRAMHIEQQCFSLQCLRWKRREACYEESIELFEDGTKMIAPGPAIGTMRHHHRILTKQ